MTALGYQEKNILLYLLKNPGSTTYKFKTILKITNRAELRLEEKGFIKNKSKDPNKKSWHLTDVGLEELKDRELI